MIKKLLLINILIFTHLFAIENISLSKTLLRFQGSEYNMLLFPKQIIVEGRKRRTKRAINEGYIRAIQELIRTIRIKGFDVNIKAFNENGSNIPQYQREDQETYRILNNIMRSLVQVRTRIKDQISTQPQNQTINIQAQDQNFGDDAFDISSDNLINNQNRILSPAEIFKQGFVDLSRQYNNQVERLSDVFHPFNARDGRVAMKHVHSVFGIAYFPITETGRRKMISMYIVLANINTETRQSVQIVVKEIPKFQWDRNYLYINAASGKVIRQIISNVLGEPLLIIKN